MHCEYCEAEATHGGFMGCGEPGCCEDQIMICSAHVCRADEEGYDVSPIPSMEADNGAD